jgi:hypothetical protein
MSADADGRKRSKRGAARYKALQRAIAGLAASGEAEGRPGSMILATQITEHIVLGLSDR